MQWLIQQEKTTHSPSQIIKIRQSNCEVILNESFRKIILLLITKMKDEKLFSFFIFVKFFHNLFLYFVFLSNRSSQTIRSEGVIRTALSRALFFKTHPTAHRKLIKRESTDKAVVKSTNISNRVQLSSERGQKTPTSCATEAHLTFQDCCPCEV